MGRLRKEVWKIHPIYTDYAISDWGKVRNKRGKILKPFRQKDGYLTITLIKKEGQKTKIVHRLVLETFIGLCPDNHECNHKDGVKGNNALLNLEWTIKSDNEKHAYKNKLKIPIKGEECNLSKLKEGEVWLIKKLLLNKIPQTKIAKMFKVHRNTISFINLSKTWKHIKLKTS